VPKHRQTKGGERSDVTVNVVAVFGCGGPFIQPLIEMLKVISGTPHLEGIPLSHLEKVAQVFTASFTSVSSGPK
jgi:hypothetical protein